MVETTVQIEGMMCGMCEAHVNSAIRSKFNVRKVTSSHTKGQAVILSDAPLDEAALTAAINETGYQATGCVTRPATEKKGLFGLFRKKA